MVLLIVGLRFLIFALFPESLKEKRGGKKNMKKCSSKQGSINSPVLAFLDPS